MKAKSLLFPVLAAIVLLGSASCEKNFTGKAIKVHSRTVPGGLFTKTTYTGEVSGNYERIDWSDGDIIVIAMKNNEVSNEQHTYSVGDISAKGRYSEAGLEPGGGNGLEWGTGTHDFWAAFPSSVTMGDHAASADIPAAQTATFLRKKNDIYYYGPDMSKTFMVASQQAAPSAAGIDLNFAPAYTAFDFTVGTNSDIIIKSFVMETTTSGLSSNVDLSGTVTATFDPASAMSCSLASTSTGQSLTVSFLDANGNSSMPSLTQDEKINFKVFAVPQVITGVRISFTLSTSAGDVTHSLRLKENDSWISFPAGAKTNISGLLIPGAVWHITFEYPREEQWVEHSDIEVGVE